MLRRMRSRRHLYRYSSFYKKPMPRMQRLILSFLVFLLLVSAGISLVLLQLRPLIYKEAKTAVTDVVQTEVNTVIQQETLNGSFDYSKLVTLEKDNNGNITALTTNTALINTLQTRISNGVFKHVSNEVISDLRIPIGNAVGGVIFSGRGPKIDIKILSVADVDTKFTPSYVSAGINQTQYKLYLDIWVEVNIMVPGYSTQTLTVTTQVLIYDTVIVGQVPNVYADIGTLGGNT